MSESKPKADRPKRKAPRTAFKPGQSGNPGGRKPLTEEQRTAREMLAAGGPAAVEYLLAVVTGVEEADTKERIAAAKVFVDKLEPVKLEMKLDTTDDTGLIEVMKKMAGVTDEKPQG